MAQIRLERALHVPAVSGFEALGATLDAIARQDGPWAGFALHIRLGEMHLPDVGYVAVPITLEIPARHPEARSLDISFSASSHPSAFPTFDGAMGVEENGSGESSLWLSGTYEVPLHAIGRVIDAALISGVAERTLQSFIDEIAEACTARVNKREAEFMRYRFYSTRA